MAKVLKTKRKGNFNAHVSNGGIYNFLYNPACKGMQLVMNDKHAEEILDKYPGEFEVIPENKWPERFKDKAKELHAARVKEAAKAFPDLINEKVLKPAKEAVGIKPKGGK